MGLIWLLISCAAVTWLQGVLLGRRALANLTYSRQLSAGTCHAGDRIEMVETIANRKRVPVPWLRLEAMLPSSLMFTRSKETSISRGSIYQNHTSLFTLPPRTRITRTYQVGCSGRGVFSMESVTMTGSDLFGIFMPSRTITLGERLVVYPQLLQESELPASWRTWQGELAVQRWIVDDPFLLTGVREYAPGDPMNRIHWKASARTGKLQVHRTGYSADPRAMICLNIEESESMWSVVTEPDRIEAALSCAATAAASLIRQGMAAGFGHNAYSVAVGEEGSRVEPAYGMQHLAALLEAMAAVELKARMPFHEFLALEAERETNESWDYLLVTAHVSDRIAEAIVRLEAMGHRVTVDREVLRKEGPRS